MKDLSIVESSKRKWRWFTIYTFSRFHFPNCVFTRKNLCLTLVFSEGKAKICFKEFKGVSIWTLCYVIILSYSKFQSAGSPFVIFFFFKSKNFLFHLSVWCCICLRAVGMTILKNLFKQDVITRKQRLMDAFSIIFMMMLM